jgi:enoyl-CoA hydratase/carnithine racemase
MRGLSDGNQSLPLTRKSLAGYEGRHFKSQAKDRIALITLNRPYRKNPLTFDSYAELRELFRSMSEADDINVIILTGAGENFCSGDDVHEIIGPLTKLDMPGLLAFTRMTGNAVKAMRACPQPIIAAIDGVCVGAGVAAPTCDLARPAARPPFCLPASAWPDAIWEHVPCCRA